MRCYAVPPQPDINKVYFITFVVEIFTHQSCVLSHLKQHQKLAFMNCGQATGTLARYTTGLFIGSHCKCAKPAPHIRDSSSTLSLMNTFQQHIVTDEHIPAAHCH
jgi:hypothetical protein